jgi:hypothetical protein
LPDEVIGFDGTRGRLIQKLMKRLLLCVVCLGGFYGMAQIAPVGLARDFFSTRTQPRILEQRIGVNGAINSSRSWSSSGPSSNLLPPLGTAVPVPNSWILGLTTVALFALLKWRRDG